MNREKKTPFNLQMDKCLRWGKCLNHCSIVWYLFEKAAHSYLSALVQQAPLQITADHLKIRGQVQVAHTVGVTTPELNEEIVKEVVNIITLPFPRWKYYWLKYIFEAAWGKFKSNILYLWHLCMVIINQMKKHDPWIPCLFGLWEHQLVKARLNLWDDRNNS